MLHKQNNERSGGFGKILGWAMVLHLVCCGLPVTMLLLISAGLTVEVLWRAAPYLAMVGAIVGVGSFIYTLRQRCWMYSPCDHNMHGRTERVRVEEILV